MTSMTGYNLMKGSFSGNPSGQTSLGGRSFANPPKGYGSFKNFTPEQMQLFQQMFGHVGPESFLSRLSGGDEATFSEMEAPALRQFNELQGGLASRFSGMGGLGARHSSGFQNTSTAAASNFAQDLASKRQELQRQALLDLMGISNNLLGQEPYSLYQKPPKKKSSGLGGLIGAGVGGLGGFLAGGPAGALAGSQLGYGIGSPF